MEAYFMLIATGVLATGIFLFVKLSDRKQTTAHG
jgi:hypothetical protein